MGRGVRALAGCHGNLNVERRPGSRATKRIEPNARMWEHDVPRVLGWERDVDVDGEADSKPNTDDFSFRAHKDGTVRIAFKGKVVTTLAGKEATRFLARVDGADPARAQLALAKATGNFKRGNERQAGRP